MVDRINEALISGKEFTNNYYERLKKCSVFIKNNLIDSDGCCI